MPVEKPIPMEVFGTLKKDDDNEENWGEFSWIKMFIFFCK